jgi:hypothetical protein
MKKWYGGVLIIGLAFLFIASYTFIGKHPQRQSAYDFFNPTQDSTSKPTSMIESSHTVSKTPEKIPHLVDFEGLQDLYSLNNISNEDSKPLLVWAQMRALLSRSDSLPETAQGIKEAAIAWKELLTKFEEDKAAILDNSTRNESQIRDYKGCPYSVSANNSSSSRNNSVILEIPCGLVDDSSVTIIGTPNGQMDHFEIEFIGPQSLEELNPAIILHYSVILPGENLTKEPVIVQNTRTSGVGWGEEERCPNQGSTKTDQVDGLVKCNEQVIRSHVEENTNSNSSHNQQSSNVSDGNAHVRSNFPFSEGSLFTSTLWSGIDGFHMTVNGRHQTSFSYREKLDASLVSGVRVVGGVDVLYAVAKGLPVSEDLDLLINVETLKAPPITKKRLVMLIGVFSSGNNFERRMALRRSWMQYEAVRSGDVAVRFFIGLHKNKQVNLEIWREAQTYGDIQLMPFVDYYSLLSLKTVAICILGTKIYPAKYMMKADDDAFIRIDEVLSSLKKIPSDGILYGLISFESKPERDKNNKWHISTEEWPKNSYPPWAHGPGYVISRDIAKFIVRGHHERFLRLFKLEDVAAGIWIEEFKKKGNKVEYRTNDRFYNAGCESNYILAHYQSPRKVLCLWEKLQRDHEPNCCE